jgi:signal transduction histidine kinase
VAAGYRDVAMEGTRLPADVETHLYRMAQEALHNVYRHADASHVSVVLERRGGDVLLVIEDNGCGFDPEGSAGTRAGMGLLGMRERASLINAEVYVESAPGNGTAVYVRVPGSRSG